MKKTLTLVGLGACLLVVFPSCSSTDDDGFASSFEEALPMSTVGDGDIPPWLLEDNSGVQIDAGETTLIPAPDEPIADAGGRASARQNQPNIADNDDVIIDSPSTPTTVIDPLSGESVVLTQQDVPPVSKPTPPQPSGSVGIASTNVPKTGTSKPTATKTGNTKSNVGKKAGTKGGKRYNEPTMLVYKVRKGDNLSDIAKRSNTTVAQIRKDSGIKGDLIHPGQVIKVRYTPKGYKPAAKAGKGSKGAKLNSKAAAGSGKAYTVRRGETISGIAKKNGISTAALLKANNMKAADAVRMRAGQRLVIPKN